MFEFYPVSRLGLTDSTQSICSRYNKARATLISAGNNEQLGTMKSKWLCPFEANKSPEYRCCSFVPDYLRFDNGYTLKQQDDVPVAIENILQIPYSVSRHELYFISYDTLLESIISATSIVSAVLGRSQYITTFSPEYRSQKSARRILQPQLVS